jgi:hypothetical protein
MNTSMKQILTAGLLVLGLGWMVQEAQAAPNPDTIVVSVTPSNSSVKYGVVITSPAIAAAGVGYDFSSVDLGATTGSTLAITVKSSGTVSEFFVMDVVSDGSADAWVPVNPADGALSLNHYGFMGHFMTTNTQPVDSSFDGTADAIYASNPTNGTGLYNQGASPTAPGTSLYLWMKLRMPPSVSNPGTRKLTVAITGQPT